MYTCRLYAKKVERGEDHISKLPDETIAQILSSVPTKYAVRTSALSRHWRYKWTSIYDINIEDDSRVEVQGTSFGRFVDRVLDFTRNSKIKSFRLLSVNMTMTDRHKISRWITAILSLGVQKLEIEACEVQGALLPRCFTDACTTLEELKLTLGMCTLAVFAENCFPNLKILYLDGEADRFKILNCQSTRTSHLLLNFPVLQVLELRCCTFLNVKSVEIRAPELITYNSHGIEEELNDYEIKVWGPKLATFCSCSGFLYNFVLHAPSLYYMDLYHLSLLRFKSIESLAPRANAILRGVPGLVSLKISNTIVQALLRERGLVLPTLDQLKRLEVPSSDAKSLLEFLQLMPNLEALNIYYCPGADYKFNRDPEEPLPLCIVSHLKTVEFIGFRGQRSEYDHINLFLEHAMKLERVFVYIDRTSGVDYRNLWRKFTSSKSSASITFFRDLKCYSLEEESITLEGDQTHLSNQVDSREVDSSEVF